MTVASGSRRGGEPEDASGAGPNAPDAPAHSACGAARFGPGTILAGRYRIEHLAGFGGMGEVYCAEDLKLGQRVALKFLPTQAVRDERMISRLLNEVRAARQVSHPNVCRVYDVGEVEGEHFLSMEYIDGEDLSTLLRRKGRIDREMALSIARQLCAGLASAHERGVLHRDLKPSNVMLDESGVVRITDFGLAEIATVVGGRKAREGSPHYMAPEQLEGREVTVRSDLYALGLVLYELFTGHPVREGRTLEEIVRSGGSRRAPSRIAPDIDRAVEKAILRCLEPDPSRRPSSARDVASVLPGGAAFVKALAAAQQRADRIAAFRAELGELRRARVVQLEDSELTALDKYHDGVLKNLVDLFDIDVSERGKHLSLGMRIVSLLGSLAFAASVVLLYLRFWGLLSIPAQLAILVASPMAALAITGLLARRERSGYFATIAALAAVACLVLNVVAIWQVFDMRASPYALLGWGLFGLVLAYGWRLRLPLVVGLISLVFFIAGWLTALGGGFWAFCLMRPESMLPAGLLACAAPVVVPHRNHPGFRQIYRALGLIALFLPIVLLAMWGHMSWLRLDPRAIAVGYQVVGFAGAACAIWLGIRRQWSEVVYSGSVCFTVLLYMRLFDWWWNWMPRYLFFFIVGVISLGVLGVLKRLREATVSSGGERPS